jgi:glycosyltransferase involved in cell wall biosynthesis
MSVGSRIRRARFAATPAYAWRALFGNALARWRIELSAIPVLRFFTRGGPPPPADLPVRRASRSDGRNVLFVSHCDFTGNSAYHVYAIATELERLGWAPAIAVPRGPRGVRDLGRPRFPVLSFRDARGGRLRFPDGQGPDLVHAFTPREAVRGLTIDLVRRHGCRYVVHLEDNEMAVRRAVVGEYDPEAARAFLEGASGVTAVIDRLNELKPEHVPGTVIWPGYDDAIERPGRPREAIRRDIGLADNEVAIVYPGNVHEANLEEVRSLYQAAGGLRAIGHDLILVKTGWNSVSPSRLPRLGAGIRDLGWISRRRVYELLHAADILVQPGAPGPFNDYRFPSKLPEFLASGRPVVLPRTNIGLHLDDGVEAILLERGDAVEIERKVGLLVADPRSREQLGLRGREFALRELQWSNSVDRLITFYGLIRDVGVAATGVEDGKNAP